ncbi:MAG: hypothetical protein RLZZ553_562 [Verrucomicrobiota bacterium]|jgi:hypothetical protein
MYALVKGFIKLLILLTLIVKCTYADYGSDDAAYDEGYAVGLSKHDSKEDTLPDKNIELMLSDCPSNQKTAWKKGYTDGFTGKKRGGMEDLPKLPELPIKIDQEPNLFYVQLKECGKEGPLPEASPESLKLGWWLVGLMRKHEGVQTKPNNHHG